MKKISSLEYNSLIWFVMRATVVGIILTNILSISRQDAWIGGLLALVLGVIPFILFVFIHKQNENINVLDLNVETFGFFGKILNFILTIGTLVFAILILSDLTYFISSQFLYKTSYFIIALAFIIPLAYALYKGVNAFFKACLLCFFMVVLTVIFIDFSLINGVNVSNLEPVFVNGFGSILHSSLFMIGYTVLPLFLLLIIPRKMINNYSAKKSFGFYVLSFMTIIIGIFLTLSVYGLNLSLLFEFPELQLLKKVEIGDFISKLEGVLALEWIVGLFFLLLIAVYFVTVGIKNCFKLKEKNNYVIIIVCALILFLNQYTFPLNGITNDLLNGPILIMLYIIYLFIPIITLTGSYLKKLHNKNSCGDKHDYD